MADRLQVLSVYDGFFTGGARILHTDVLTGLHGRDQRHSVLSIHREVRRETTLQRMQDDTCYRSLMTAGISVTTLGRSHGGGVVPSAYSTAERASLRRRARTADVLLSLKEQPLGLINQAQLGRVPVVVCLHRSDPHTQAIGELRAAVAAGRITAGICCARSTMTAYRDAGVPEELLTVIPNGVDGRRFRPDRAARAGLRKALGIESEAGVVVFAARYDAMKNVPLFLASAADFLRREPDGHVVACGPGMDSANTALRTDLTAAFAGEDAGGRRRLHLLGVRGDMPAVYAAGDVVALTSASGEAAPLCLIEGMMCGAVPVATDVGDTALLVAGRGILTPSDPAAISNAWSRAATHRAAFAPALAQARGQFDRSRMLNAYAEIIETVGHRAAAPASACGLGAGLP